MNIQEISKKLSAYFPEENIKWRISATTQDKTKGLAVPYIDTRAIQKEMSMVIQEKEFLLWQLKQKEEEYELLKKKLHALQ